MTLNFSFPERRKKVQNGSEGENEAINSIVPKEEIYNTVEFAVDDEPES